MRKTPARDRRDVACVVSDSAINLKLRSGAARAADEQLVRSESATLRPTTIDLVRLSASRASRATHQK
jgi:hypothetical protein